MLGIISQAGAWFKAILKDGKEQKMQGFNGVQEFYYNDLEELEYLRKQVYEAGEIYLTEPELEPFLHQFRHHLQNVERKYDRRGLTAEGLNGLYYKVPYTKCVYKLYGEDDARAWARMVIELAS